ncbi:9340_t:CDS:10 [Dentiscutata erythropus]|uniref:Mediator of RNA polymerase II transcription subunit 16 n=1 Tax=Dentiscutata erythropus TaxID=1348616 RepID=A0A9N9DTI3_9GLOM|nr:9340_t:CDS:10 [Dentiscutata erythropus]
MVTDGLAVKTSATQEFAIEKLYHEICYKKTPRRIAWSPQNLIAWSPTNSDTFDTRHQGSVPSIGIFNPCRLPSDDGSAGSAWSFTRKSNFFPLNDIEKHHRHGDEITDLVWNQTGSALASIDQRGKIALWMMDNFVNQWKCICDVDLGGSIVEFSWLDYVRVYSRVSGTGTSMYKRGTFKGPRNQFGEFAFLTVTSDGKVTVCYQDGKRFFSKINTELPFISGRISRISHADLILNKDGRYILAIHCPEYCQKIVMFYEISVDMLKLHINCQPIADVHLTAHINDSSFTIDRVRAPIIHLKLLSDSQDNVIKLIVVTADKADNGDGNNIFNSDVIMWELQTSPISLDFSSLPLRDNNHSKEIRFVAGTHLPGQLVTNIWVHKRELFIGLSNGQTQFRNCAWIPHNGKDDSNTSAITEFATSPNGTLLLCGRLSGELDCFDMADINWASSQTNIDIMDLFQVAYACVNQLTLSILNNTDHTDLENIVRKHYISAISESNVIDQLDLILQRIFVNISNVFPHGFESAISSDFLIRLFGLQLSLLKSCGRDNISYLNTLFTMHLRALEITFRNSISSDDSFVADSLPSLVSLTSWILDFFAYFIRNIYLLYFTKSQGHGSANEKSHIVLLYHSISRSALENLISYVGQFEKYIAKLYSNNPSDPKNKMMHRSLQYSFEKWPLKLDLLGSFIKESRQIIEKTLSDSGLSDSKQNMYLIILRSVLPQSLHGTLKEIEQIFITSFNAVNKVKLYAYDTKLIESVSIDIVLKSRTSMDRTCIRCGHYSAIMDVQNTRWAKSYTRSCVCGGLWIDIRNQ